MADMKIIIGADIKNLQSELAKAGGVTQDFANKTTSVANKAGQSISNMGVMAGKAASQIGTLGASLISGGIITGVLLLGTGLLELSKKLIGLSEAQKLSNEALSSGKDEYVKATLLVDRLKDRIQLAKDGVISKEMALREYNNTMGKTTGAVKTLDEAEQELVNNGPKYIQYTLLKAAAQFTAQKAAEKLFDAELKSAKAQEVNSRIKQDDIGQFIKSGEENIRKQKRLDDQKKVNLLNSIADSFNKQADEIAKGFKKITAVTEVEGKKLQEAYVRTLPAPWKGAFLGPEAPTMTIKPDVTIVPNVKEVVITPEAQKSVLDGMKKMFDKAQLEQFQEDATVLIQEAITEIQINAITSAAEAVGEALAGNKNALPDLFGNLIKGIGNQIANLGKALISAGIKMLAAKKAIQALNLTPQTAIIAGVALVILGSALKASLNKQVQGFASGTTGVSQGGFYDVGERGRERVFLPQGSKVQPANEVQAFGGGGVMLQPSIHYEGTGFRIMLNRVDAQMSRNG